MKHAKQCKTCGINFKTADKRQVVCSRECGHRGRRKNRVSVTCGVCGKIVERYEAETLKRTSFACGKQCQVRMAARAGKDIVKASLRAKRKWYTKRSAERRKANGWVRLCSCQLEKLNSGLKAEDVWKRRCQAAMVSLGKRAKAGCGKKQREISTWGDAIEKAYSEKRTCSQSKWSKKCSSIVLNLKRRQLKRQQQN